MNNTLDTHTSRVASLGNRVPTPLMLLLVVGSAIAVGALAFYLTLLGKGLATSLITAVVVLIILFVSLPTHRRLTRRTQTTLRSPNNEQPEP